MEKIKYITTICRRFTFEASHFLKWHQGKCRSLHGHSYKLLVWAKGTPNKNGVIVDFGDLKGLVEETIIYTHDHVFLNDLYDNPTAELMAGEILSFLNKKDNRIFKIRLYETENSYAETEIEN